MKTSILLVTFVWLSFQSFCQYSRSVYSDDTQAKRHTSLFSINGETTIINLRESSNDTLRVMLIDIDEEGETENYRMYEYSPFDLSLAFALSGVGVNSSNEVTLCLLSQTTSSLDVKYITIDPANGTFSNPVDIIGQYKKGFTRTRAKGDSLITYLANYTATGISRIAKSLSGTGISSEVGIYNDTYSGTLFQNRISCELIVSGTIEYIATSSVILKRTSSNNYINTTYSGFLGAPKIAVNSSGKLFVEKNGTGEYLLLDANLNTSASGSIPELQGSITSLSEIYALPNDDFRIWTNRFLTPSVMDITSNFAVINKKAIRNNPLDQLVLDGKQYLIGYDLHASKIDAEGTPFQLAASNVTITYDDLTSSPMDFIEFDQVLTTDKIQFHTNHVGRSFTNANESSAGFKFNQNSSDRSLIFSATSGTLGTIINNTLLGAANTYESLGATGPYCAPGSYNMETMDEYNRGYYVTAEMIENHIAGITSGNPAYKIPFGIREWPAHGDVSLGQAANLAGFFDQNGNSVYEPELGDYPSIYGDQCLLNIYHEHPNTPSSASIETHQYYFTFDCNSSGAIKNTVFIRSHNFSRSHLLFDTYTGNYVDFDLGNYSDDHIGTNVELAMIYAYNGDHFDETNAGNQGFQDTIPAVGMLTLLGAKVDNDGIDNPHSVGFGGSINGVGFGDNIPDNEFYTMESSYAHPYLAGGAPSNISNWYNVMQGLNPDGSPKTINGITVKHDYFGTSDPQFYTSNGIDHGNNNSEGIYSNQAGDRRISCASGPVIFSNTDTMVLINAYLVGVDTINLSPDSSLVRLFEHGQTLRDFYAQNSDECGNTFDAYLADNVLSVIKGDIQQIILYPNPAKSTFKVQGITGKARVQIIDLNGRIVAQATNLTNEGEISIQHLDSAIYLVSIEDEIGKQVIRLVKK